MQRAHDTQRSLGIHSLPDELLARVLAHLPSARDFGRADGVCRAWHATDSPVELALRQRIEARDGALPAALPVWLCRGVGGGSMLQRMCWVELLREARAASGLVGVRATARAAVNAHGQLLTWGEMKAHRIPYTRVFIDHTNPRLVPELLAVRVRRVCFGENHALVLTDTGEVRSFGEGARGGLGHGDVEDRTYFKVIEALRGMCVVAIAAGSNYSMVLTHEGAVLSFGGGGDGKLGHGDRANQLVPKVIEALRGVCVVAIAAGLHHSMVLTDEGEVLSFGSGWHGRLGHGDWEDQLVPKAIEALRGRRLVAIAAGDGHSMVLTDKGVVLSFGRGHYGQLGHGEQNDLHRPTVIEKLRGKRIVAIAAGDWHSMVLTDEGTVLSFGYNAGDHGLGHRDCYHRLRPAVVEALCGKFVVAIAAGGSHSMVRTNGPGAEVLVCGGEPGCGWDWSCGRPPQYPFRRHQLDLAASTRELDALKRKLDVLDAELAADRPAEAAPSVERVYLPSRLTY